MSYTWKELNDKYNWGLSADKKSNEKIQCAKARGVIIKQLERKKEKERLKYEIVEEFPFYYKVLNFYYRVAMRYTSVILWVLKIK